MKPVKEVEKDRISYYKNINLNSVHRSSLLIPKIEGHQTYISFVNHYLIKRNYNNVILKLTAYDKSGLTSDSLSYDLKIKKVYTYSLERIFGDQYNSYQAEFFSSENLFIPYPAVMINHVGKYSINTVHAYNRILNDSRESEKINVIHVREASIDVMISKEIDTFFILHSGILPISNQELEVELKSALTDSIYNSKFIINMPKMSVRKYYLSDLISNKIKEKITKKNFTLKIKQPKQELFYGRLLAGIEKKDSRSFSANHSFYDNSKYAEYFSNNESYKTYPLLKNHKNIIRMYPIMSPGEGTISVYLNYGFKYNLDSIKVKEYPFNNTKVPLEIDLNKLKAELIDNYKLATFSLIYKNNSKDEVPTRINMQLVYGSLENTEIDASINQSLYNDELFLPKNKKSFAWCQLINDKKYKSNLSICFIDNINIKRDFTRKIKLDFYDENGHISESNHKLNPLDSLFIENPFFESSSKFIWVTAKSDCPQLHMFSIHTNNSSKYTSGEHNF